MTLRCWITQDSVTWLVGDNQLDTPRCFWWKSGLWGVCKWAQKGILKLISVCFLYLDHLFTLISIYKNTCLQAWKNLIKHDFLSTDSKNAFNRLSLGLAATCGSWLCCKTMSFAHIQEATIYTCYFLKRRRQWHPTPVLLPGKSMDGGAWWAAVHGVARSQTRLSSFTLTFHFHALEKEMATHSSVLAWRIPGMGEPDGLPSMGSHRVRHDWSNLAAAAED